MNEQLATANVYFAGVLMYLLDVKKLMQDRGKDTKRIDEQIENMYKAKAIYEQIEF
jgi:hypothetical protein